MHTINPEKLAYWYFRLNGFLSIENFVIHPDWKYEQRTDIDLVAVRFPYRDELPENPMKDDTRIILAPDKIRIVLAEVKTGMCDLNDSWLNRNKNNMQQILYAIGSFENVVAVSEELYEHGWYENNNFVFSLFCLGQRTNQTHINKLPRVPQLTWDEVLFFIHERFRHYEDQKCSHEQWDETGHTLWDLAKKHFNFNEFRSVINVKDEPCHKSGFPLPSTSSELVRGNGRLKKLA